MKKFLIELSGVLLFFIGIVFSGYIAWTQMLIAGLMEGFQGLQTQTATEVGWGVISVIFAGPAFVLGFIISFLIAKIIVSSAAPSQPDYGRLFRQLSRYR